MKIDPNTQDDVLMSGKGCLGQGNQFSCFSVGGRGLEMIALVYRRSMERDTFNIKVYYNPSRNIEHVQWDVSMSQRPQVPN